MKFEPLIGLFLFGAVLLLFIFLLTNKNEHSRLKSIQIVDKV
jgi:hypothetical protein